MTILPSVLIFRYLLLECVMTKMGMAGEGGDESRKWRCEGCDMSDGGEIGC